MFARRRDLGEHDVVAPGGRVVGKGGNVLKVARISQRSPTSSWFKECGPASLDNGPFLKQNKWNRLSWSFLRSRPDCDTLMNPRAGATRP